MSSDIYITSFVAKLVSNTSVTLTWSGNFNTVTIKYSINTSNYTTAVSNYSSTSYTITGLSENMFYYFTIIPYDSDSNAGTTEVLYITTGYTPEITSAATTSATSSTIPISWSGTYYKLGIDYKRTVDTTYTTIYPISATSSYTITGLDASTSYVFLITPYDTNDISGTSYTLSATTDYDSYISDTYLGTITARTVYLSWTGYYSYASLQYSTDNSTWETAAIMNTGLSTSNDYEFVLLDPSSNYYFRVYPYSSNFNLGTVGSTVQGNTLAGFTYVALDTTANTYLDFSFNGRYDSIDTYISYDGNTYSYYSTLDLSSAAVESSSYIYSTYLSVTGLLTYTDYYIYFQPYNQSVMGTSSEIFMVTTDYYAEANVSIGNVTASSINILFGTTGLTYPYYYSCLVEVSEDDATYYDFSMVYSVPSPGNTVTCTVDSLNALPLYANYTYYFTIIPYSAVGTQSPYIYYLSHATLGNVESDAITLSIEETVILLKWTGYFKSTYVEYTTDNFAGTATVNSVTVTRDSSISSTTKDITTSEYYFSTLSSGTTYYFRLTPINYNGDYGTTSDVHYNATITEIYMSEISDNYLVLNWAGTYGNVTIQSSSDNLSYSDYEVGIDTSYITISTTGSTTTYYQIIPYNNYGESGLTSNTTYNPTITSITTSVVDSQNLTLSWEGSYDYLSIQYSLDNNNYYFVYTDLSDTTSVTISDSVISGYDTSYNTYYYNIIPYRYGYPTTYLNQGLTSSTTYNATIASTYFDNISYYTITLYYIGVYEKAIVYYDTSSGFTSGTYMTNMVPNDGTEYSSSVFTSLSSNTTYYFKIIPYNTNDENGYIIGYQSATTTSLFIGLDMYWSADDSSQNYLTFKWTNNGYNKIKIYNSAGTLKLNSSTQTYLTDTGLSPNNQYAYYVLLYDYNNNYETSSSYYYGYTNPIDTSLNFQQVIYSSDVPSGYSLSSRRVLFTWSSTSYYNNITITNATTGSTAVSFSVSGGVYVYDSSANGEGLLTQNTSYTYTIKLSGYSDSAITTYTKTATTFGSISNYAVVNTGSYLITASSLPVSYTGIFNGVIFNISDGVKTGNVTNYGISSGSSSYSSVYTLNSSNSIITEANKYYSINIYTLNDVSYVLLGTSTPTYAYTLGKITNFSYSSIVDNSSVKLYWDGCYNSVGLETTTASDFTSATVSSNRYYGTTTSKTYDVTGLLPNKKYYFRLTPINQPLSTGGDVSGTSVTWDVSATTMGKITSFSAGYTSDFSSNAVALSWDGSFAAVSIAISISENGTYTTYSGSPYYTNYAIIQNLKESNYKYHFKITPINSNWLYSNISTGGVYARSLAKITDISWTLTADISSVTLYIDGSFAAFTIDECTVTDFSSATVVSQTFTTAKSNKLYVFNELAYNTKYYLRVRPYNEPTSTSGNVYGSSSNLVTAYTWAKITSFTVDTSNTTAYTVPLLWDGSFNAARVKISADGGVTYSDTSAVMVYGTTTTFSNLAGFTTYYFLIYPYNDISAVGNYTQVTATTLAYIGNIYASSITATGFTVNLSDSKYSSFYIYNSTNSTSYSAVDYPQTAISMSSLTANTYYTVTAYAYNYTNLDGCGNTVSATLENTKTLGSITGVTNDVSTSYYSVYLYGSYNSFKIEYTVCGETYDSSYVSYGNKIYVYNLSANTQYTYIVYANNYDNGAGTDVSSSFTVTTAGSISNAFSAKSNYAATNSISFNMTQGSFSALRIKTAYNSSFTNLLYSVDVSYSDIASVYNYSYSQSGLSENTQYYFVAVAINSSGSEGDTSTTTLLSTLGNLYSFALDTSNNPITTNSIPIKWYGTYYKALVEYTTASAASYNTYAYYTNNSSETSTPIYGNTYINADLLPNTQYYFRCTPISLDINSGTSLIITDASAVTLGEITSTTTVAYYDTSASFLIDGSFTQLTVYSSPASIVKTYNYTTGGVSTGSDISGLVYDTSYVFYFLPLNSIGVSNPINGIPNVYVNIRTWPKITRFYLTGISAITYNSIGVSWDGSFSTVEIDYSTDGVTYIAANTVATGYSLVISGLASNTQYYFRAIPSKNGAIGKYVYLSDPSAITYGYIKTFTAVKYDNSAVSLAWDGSYNNVQIYVSTSAGSYTGSASTYTGYSTIYSGLASNQTYYFKALAINTTGTSSVYIQDASALTYPYVKSLTAAAIDSSAIQVAWDGSFASVSIFYSTVAGTYIAEQSASYTGYSTLLTGLASNQVYYYKAVAVNADGSGVIIVQDISAITYPYVKSLTATPYDNSAVQVTWDGSFASVSIFYSTTAGTYIATQSASYTGYTALISGLASNQLYYYRAVAVNADGSGVIVVQDISALTYPYVKSLTAAAIDSSAIQVAWDGSFASMTIFYSTTAGSYVYSQAASYTGYDTIYTNLSPNTTYYYKAVAVNADGSGVIVVQDVSALTYGYIKSLSVTAYDSSSIQVTWDGSFSSVTLAYSTTAGTYPTSGSAVYSYSNTYTTLINGFTTNVVYYFKIVSVNETGTGSIYVQDVSTITYSSVSTFTASAVDMSSITVTWDGTYSTAELYYSNTSGTYTIGNSYTYSSGSSTLLSGLSSNTTYYYKLITYNSVGTVITTIEDINATTYGYIKTISATAYDSSAVIVAWDGSFTSVNVYYSTTASTYTGSAVSFSSGYSGIINGLYSNEIYYFKVSAINTTGTGAITQQDASALTYPYVKSLTAAPIDSSAVQVTWDGSFASVSIFYSTTAGTYVAAQSASYTGYTATIDGLASNQVYYYMAVAVNADGSGSIIVQDISALTYPYVKSLTAAPIDSSAVQVTWDGSFASVSIFYSTTAGTYVAAQSASYTGYTATIGGLASNQVYYYMAVAVNADGSGSIIVQDVSALTYGYIKSLTATAIDSSAVQVIWDGSFSSLTLYYSTTAGTYTQYTSYTGYSTLLTGLSSNQTYYYKAVAVNANGNGSITIQDISALTYPYVKTLTATPYDSSAVLVSWDGSFSSVTLYYSTTAGTYTQSTSYTGYSTLLTGLASNQLYYYKAIAVNANGNGSITIQDISALTYPYVKSLSATAIDSSAIQVAWDGSFASMTIFYSTTAGSYVYSQATTYSGYAATYNNLSANTRYYYKAVAVNADGSGVIVVQDVSALTYGFINSLTLTAYDSSSIQVAWDGSFSSVTLAYSTTAGTYPTSGAAVFTYSNTYSTLINGFTTNVVYYFKIVSVNETGTGSIYVQDVSTITSSTVSTFTASAVDMSSISLAWNGSFTTVNLYYSTTSGTYTTGNVYTYGSTTTGVTLSGLSSNTTYYYKLIAYNSVGTAISTIQDVNATTYGFIKSISATAYDSSAVRVTWDGSFTSVNVYYSTTASTYTGTAVSFSSGYTGIVNGLYSNAVYYFKVAAVNTTGTGAITKQDASALTFPYVKTLTATAMDSSAIKVAWDGSFASMTVYYSTTAGIYTQSASYTGYSNTFNSLAANTTYYYKAVAVNANGNGTIVIQDVSALTYSYMKTLTATAIDSSGIQVAWDGSFSSVTIYYSTTAGSYTQSASYTGYNTIFNTLASNTTYYYKAVAVNANGNGSITIQDVSALTYPYMKTLTAVAIDSSSIQVTWDGSFASVTLYYSTTAGTYTQSASYTGYSATFNTLSSNTRYYYKAVAVNANGNGSITIQDVSALTYPYMKTLTAVAIDSSAIRVTWDGSFSSVTLYYSTTKSNYTGAQSASYTGYSATISSLSSNTTYYYKVVGVNTTGNGYIVIQDVSALTYSYIKTLTATAIDSSSIQVTWDGSFSSVTLYYSTTAGTYTQSVSYTGYTTTFNALSSNTRYYYKAVAVNANGNGIIAIQDVSTVTYGYIKSLTATPVDNSAVKLTWDGSFSTVTVYYSTTQSNYVGAQTATYTGYSTEITNLQSNQTYYYKIVAINSIGSSGSVIKQDVSALTYPSITKFAITSYDSSSVTFSWDGSFSYVHVYYHRTEGIYYQSKVVTSYTSDRYAVLTGYAGTYTGLMANYLYYFKITGVNATGVGRTIYKQDISALLLADFSNIVLSTVGYSTYTSTYTPYIKSLTATAYDTSAVLLTWDGSFSSVVIYYSTTASTYSSDYTTTFSSGYSGYLYNLTVNTKYYFKAVAYDSTTAGSTTIQDVSATTYGQITSLSATAIDNSGISLSWTGSYNYVNLYYSKSAGVYTSANVIAVGTGLSSYVHYNLSSNATYYYKVVAVNATGSGSTVVQDVSALTYPSITKFAITSYDSSSVTFSWDGSFSYVHVYYHRTEGIYYQSKVVTSYTSDRYAVLTGYAGTYTGLNAGYLYYFKITGVNATGVGRTIYKQDISALLYPDFSNIVMSTSVYT